jgi:hypothetical protein
MYGTALRFIRIAPPISVLYLRLFHWAGWRRGGLRNPLSTAPSFGLRFFSEAKPENRETFLYVGII